MHTIDDIIGQFGRVRTSAVAVCIVTVLVVTAGFVGGSIAQQSPTVTTDDAEVDPGATTDVTLALTEAPNGVAGFDLRVALVGDSVATITGISVDESYAMSNTSVASDGSSAYGSGVDLDRNHQSGATDVPLVTVTVEGVQNGTTPLDVLNVNIDNSDGNDVDANVEHGIVTVGTAETPTDGESTATPTNSGGGGGGGQSGQSAPAGSTQVYDTDAGSTVWFTDIQQAPSFSAEVTGASGEGVSVDGIGIDLRFNNDRFRTEVTEPTSTPPAETPTLEGASAYFSVDAYNLDWDSVEGANLTVSVDEAARPAGGVQLYHFTDGEWHALNTTATGDGEFTATTESFSPFAVGPPAEGTATATPTTDGEATETASSDGEGTDTTSSTTETSAGSSSDGGLGGLSIALVGVPIVLLLGVLLLRR